MIKDQNSLFADELKKQGFVEPNDSKIIDELILQIIPLCKGKTIDQVEEAFKRINRLYLSNYSIV